MLLDVVLVGALIILNAGFSGSELALISLREGHLRRRPRRATRGGDRGGDPRPHRRPAPVHADATSDHGGRPRDVGAALARDPHPPPRCRRPRVAHPGRGWAPAPGVERPLPRPG